MSLELRKKMREISIVIAVIVMISGALGFITQLIQFFIGRWNYTVYEEIGILLLLMGIAVAPYKIIQAFLNKVTNNKSNMSNYDEKEEDLVSVDTGGSVPDETAKKEDDLALDED